MTGMPRGHVTLQQRVEAWLHANPQGGGCDTIGAAMDSTDQATANAVQKLMRRKIIVGVIAPKGKAARRLHYYAMEHLPKDATAADLTLKQPPKPRNYALTLDPAAPADYSHAMWIRSKTPPDRFAPTAAAPMFSCRPPGQYQDDADSTHMARVYGS